MHKDEALFSAIQKDLERREEVLLKAAESSPELAADKRITMALDYIILARNLSKVHGNADNFIYTYGRIIGNMEVAIALHKEKRDVPKSGG